VLTGNFPWHFKYWAPCYKFKILKVFARPFTDKQNFQEGKNPEFMYPYMNSLAPSIIIFGQWRLLNMMQMTFWDKFEEILLSEQFSSNIFSFTSFENLFWRYRPLKYASIWYQNYFQSAPWGLSSKWAIDKILRSVATTWRIALKQPEFIQIQINWRPLPECFSKFLGKLCL
jgi:hypothetical protein